MKKLLLIALLAAFLISATTPLAKIDSVYLVKNGVMIIAVMSCPSSDAYAKKSVSDGIVRIRVYEKSVPRGGQCEDDTYKQMIRVTLNNKQMGMKIYVNGVRIK